MNLNNAILLNNLKRDLCNVINGANDSGLLMCEIELIVKDVHAEVNMASQNELQTAYAQLAQAGEQKTTTEKVDGEIVE